MPKLQVSASVSEAEQQARQGQYNLEGSIRGDLADRLGSELVRWLKDNPGQHTVQVFEQVDRPPLEARQWALAGKDYHAQMRMLHQFTWTAFIDYTYEIIQLSNGDLHAKNTYWRRAEEAEEMETLSPEEEEA